MKLLNFYCVKNAAVKKEECWTEDFGQYCELRDDPKKAFYLDKGCSRKWMNQDDDERKNSGINVLWPITDNVDYQQALEDAAAGESPNNICPIFTYSIKGGVEALWMGDLESRIPETNTGPNQAALSRCVICSSSWPCHRGKVIYEWLEQMNPSLVIIGEADCDDLNYLPGLQHHNPKFSGRDRSRLFRR